MDINTWKEFGVAGLMMGSILFIFFWVLRESFKFKHEILNQQKDILNQAATERINWITSFKEHTERARTFHEEVKEAHRFQREEHQRLLGNQERVCNALSEVEKALGRINGYVDHK